MNVLIVENEPAVRRAIRRMFDRVHDATIHETSSFREAVDAIQRVSFDFLLVDVRLNDDPDDRTGIDFIKHVRGSGSNSFAVVMTGHEDPSLEMDARRAGAEEFLLKDRLSQDLVERILAHARSTNREVVSHRPTPPSEEKTRLTAHVPVSLKRDLDLHCARRGVSLSDAVRIAVERLLASDGSGRS
jgi:DNA-binding NarL/FixJ family response regulator